MLSGRPDDRPDGIRHFQDGGDERDLILTTSSVIKSFVMDTALSLVIIFLYLLAAGMIVQRLRRLADRMGTPLAAHSPGRAVWLGVWGGGLVLHTVVLAPAIFTAQGLDLGFFHALSTISWLIALMLLLVTLRHPMENLGIVLLPLSAFGVGLGLIFPEVHFPHGEAQAGLRLHIFISLLAYSVLTMAALQAIVLAIQNRHLHNHNPGGLIKALPPLSDMETFMFHLLWLGFALLSLALASGFVFLEDIFAQRLVHKTVLSITAWIGFAVLLVGRVRYGWRGRRAVAWTLGGFSALLLAYFGSKLVIEIILA